jgi:hypothetical protein
MPLSSRPRALLDNLHLELGHVGKRPTKFGTALPQQGRIFLGSASLADADQYHLFRHPSRVDRTHEQPGGWHAGVDVKLMWAGHAHRASVWIALPLSPLLYRFV